MKAARAAVPRYRDRKLRGRRMTESAQARIARGRRVKLIVGGHYGHVTGLEQDRFQVTYDSAVTSEGGRERKRSGGKYWYRMPAAARFEVTGT
jgi:hypothetical protein